MSPTTNRNSGFSLVELMVVVGIIGILAAIAVPKLQSFSAKAKRSEVKTMLKHLHTLQTSYFAENSKYLYDWRSLGMSSDRGKYYILNEIIDVGNDQSTFVAFANLKPSISLCPGVSDDEWAVAECPITPDGGGALCAAQTTSHQFSEEIGISPTPQRRELTCR